MKGCSDTDANNAAEKMSKKERSAVETIFMNHGNFNNPTFVTQFPNLKKVQLGFCGIKEVGFVLPCKSLESLWLINNQIENAAPLASLSNLQKLFLRENNVNNIKVNGRNLLI